jgi:hypothetical protein
VQADSFTVHVIGLQHEHQREDGSDVSLNSLTFHVIPILLILTRSAANLEELAMKYFPKVEPFLPFDYERYVIHPDDGPSVSHSS